MLGKPVLVKIYAEAASVGGAQIAPISPGISSPIRAASLRRSPKVYGPLMIGREFTEIETITRGV